MEGGYDQLHRISSLYVCFDQSILPKRYQPQDMLKFVQNHPATQVNKGIKYQPEMIYGNSLEYPSQFQCSHTIFHQKSYHNPFLNQQPNRQHQLSRHPPISRKNFDKRFPSQGKREIEHEKNKKTEERISEEQPSALVLPHRLISNSSHHLVKGEFTDFIDKNVHYKSIGPLHGIERSNKRIFMAKKSVWMKLNRNSSDDLSAICNDSQILLSRKSRNSSSHLPLQPIGKTSKLLCEKQHIRQNRNSANVQYKKGIQKRKTGHAKFQLPKVGRVFLNLQEGQHQTIKEETEKTERIDSADGPDEFDIRILQQQQNNE